MGLLTPIDDTTSATSTGLKTTPKPTSAAATSGSGTTAPAWKNPNKAASASEPVTPTTSVNKNKLGPQTADNILHNYTNYTYKISVLSFKGMRDYNNMVENGTWEKMPGIISTGCYTLFSSGGISDTFTSGFAQRHPDFNLDFTITSMTTEAMMGMSSNTRATNLFTLQMEVHEPIGATLLERFESVLTEDGPNWTEKPLLIKIDFLGYDEKSNPVHIKPATRYIPVRLVSMAFDVKGEGCDYSIEFLAMCVIKENPITNAISLTTLSGSSIMHFAKQIEERFAKEQKARSEDVADHSGGGPIKGMEKKVITPKVQEFPDTIEFAIDPVIAKAFVTPRVAEQTMLRNEPMDLKAANTRGKSLDGIAAARETSPAGQFKHNESVRYQAGIRGDYIVTVADKGQTYLSLIEKLIRESTYITDQLTDPTADISGTSGGVKERTILKNPEKGLMWWKITYVKKLGGPTGKDYDNIRNMYPSHTIIQIDPYLVTDPVATDGDAKPGDGNARPAIRNYQYIYTGQNIDILNLGIQFKNAFFMAITGQGTGNGGSSKDSIKAKTSSSSGGLKAKDDMTGGGAQGTGNNKFPTTNHATGEQEQAGTLMENLYRQLGSDMMSCSLDIVGDPCYLQQDGILAMKTPNKSSLKVPKSEAADPSNGAMLSDLEDAHVYLIYRTPEDIDDAKGIVDFSAGDKRFKNSTLSGYYRIWTVSNSFTGGEFTQQLEMTRIYDQFREAKPGGEKDRNKKMSPAELEVASQIDSFSSTAVTASSTSATAAGGVPGSEDASSPSKTEVSSSDTVSDQQITVQNMDNETEFSEGEFVGTTGSSSAVNTDTTASNADSQSAVVATQTNKDINAARFRAAEAKRAGIATVTTTSTDSTTIAGRVGPHRGFNVNINQQGDPVLSVENGVVASGTNIKQTMSRNELKQQGINSRRTLSGQQISAHVVDSAGSILLSNKTGKSLYGSERMFSTSSYTATDSAGVQTNNQLIKQYRQEIISSTDPLIAKSAFMNGNSVSESNRTIHSKYGNRSYSWKEMGYFPEIERGPEN